MTAISVFRVMEHSQIFSLFFRNRIQCIALYQLHNSQALLNLHRGYFNLRPVHKIKEQQYFLSKKSIKSTLLGLFKYILSKISWTKYFEQEHHDHKMPNDLTQHGHFSNVLTAPDYSNDDCTSYKFIQDVHGSKGLLKPLT